MKIFITTFAVALVLVLAGCGAPAVEDEGAVEENALEKTTETPTYSCPEEGDWVDCMPVLSTEEAANCQWVEANCPDAEIVY